MMEAGGSQEGMASALRLLQGPPASMQGVNSGNKEKLHPSPGATGAEDPHASCLPHFGYML